MKRIINSWFVALFAAVAALAGGCTDPAGVVDELNLDRVLSPMNFEVRIENKVNANFMWTATDGVKNYQLDLQFEDGTSYEVLTIPATGEPAMEYRVNELPGQRLYTAYLYALSEDPNTANSKASIVSFETGIEQLFLEDGMLADADIQPTQVTLRWLAGSNVTHLEVSDGVNVQRIDLDEAAKAAGVYTLTGLTTDQVYTAKIFRDVAERGVCEFAPTTIYALEVVEKGAETMTIAWDAAAQIDEVRVSSATAKAKSVKVAAGAAACEVTGLSALTEYTFAAYYQGIYHGRIVATTMGAGIVWDFTTWAEAAYSAPTTVQGLTINANAATSSGKEMYISADAEFGCNYLDLKGKSSNAGKEGSAPTDRTVAFEVAADGVIAIDCYANGAGRNFAVYIESLGTNTPKYEAPIKENRGKVYIPVTGITDATNLYIWTDATINHVYSIEWTEGSEAPGQFAEALAATTVTLDPAVVNQGTAAAVTVAWTAVENAKDYTWAVSGANISGTTTELQATIPAEAVAALVAGKYNVTVTANPVSTYKFKASKGTAEFTVSDLVLAAPKVAFAPTKVEQGSATEVVASWEAVTNAASYEVSFNGGAATTQTETTYTLSAAEVAALAIGEYKISVVALPDPADVDRQQSAAGEATLTVVEPAPVAPPTGGKLVWDNDFFKTFADQKEQWDTENIDLGNGLIYYVQDGGKAKFKADGNMYRIQFGGSGKVSTMKNILELTATGPGTILMKARSGGDAARVLMVEIDGVKTVAEGYSAPDKTAEPAEIVVDCTAAKAGSKIHIYSTDSSINLYHIEWTPAAAAEPVVYEWGNDLFKTFADQKEQWDTENVDLGNGLIYYVQDGGKAKFKADSGMYRVQFGGGGKVATMKNILELTVAGPGTLTMKARSGGDVQRALIVEIDGVKTNADGYATPVKTETPADFEVDCSTAKAGSKIYIYSGDSSINLYNLKWTGK